MHSFSSSIALNRHRLAVKIAQFVYNLLSLGLSISTVLRYLRNPFASMLARLHISP